MTTFISKTNRQRGFSLVEAAIVLVVIGLSLGGVLRAKELITSSQVGSLIAQQTGIKAAYYAFVDRYSVEPGDMTVGQAALVNASTMHAFYTPNDGIIDLQDAPTFFNNLAQARFITCAACMNKASSASFPVVSNSVLNPLAAPLFVEGNYGGHPAGGAANLADYLSPLGVSEPVRLKMGSGGNTKSNLLAEMDRKMDDGNPSTGIFRASSLWYASSGVGSQNTWMSMGTCVDLSTNRTWKISPPAACQAVLLF